VVDGSKLQIQFLPQKIVLNILIAFIFTTLLQIKSRSKITQDGRLASGFFYFKKCVIM
jgi:hypothetical protein